jgi:hypothetical protein
MALLEAIPVTPVTFPERSESPKIDKFIDRENSSISGIIHHA